MIDKDIIIATLLILGTLANIVYTHTRTRGAVDTLKAEAEADEIKRRSELEDKRLEVWSQMVMALQKTTERLDSMSNAQTQTNQVTTQVSETLVKNTEVLKDQAETLDTATGLLSAVSTSQESYQKKGLTAIETIAAVPTLIKDLDAKVSDLPPRLDALHLKMDNLPIIVQQAYAALVAERNAAVERAAQAEAATVVFKVQAEQLAIDLAVANETIRIQAATIAALPKPEKVAVAEIVVPPAAKGEA